MEGAEPGRAAHVRMVEGAESGRDVRPRLGAGSGSGRIMHAECGKAHEPGRRAQELNRSASICTGPARPLQHFYCDDVVVPAGAGEGVPRRRRVSPFSSASSSTTEAPCTRRDVILLAQIKLCKPFS